MAGWQHAGGRVASGGEAVAALATARGQDRATRTGAHAQSETVGLVTTTVVRLEGALAQGNSLHSRGLVRRLTDTGSSCEARQRTGSSTGTARPRDHSMGSRAVMDMRHRSTPVSTCQRYALRDDRVKPSDGTQQHPMAGLTPAYVGVGSPRSTHPGRDRDRPSHRPGVRRSPTPARRCATGARASAGSRTVPLPWPMAFSAIWPVNKASTRSAA